MGNSSLKLQQYLFLYMVSERWSQTRHRSKLSPCLPPLIKLQTLISICQSPSAANKPLIALNIPTQINEKLTSSTFPQWCAQFEALLIGYNLLDYVEGTLRCPLSVATPVDELHKIHRVQHDKLILSAILAFTSPSITPLIATTKTSHEAWKKIKNSIC